MNKDLSRLSQAEELWLWRTRQPVPLRPDGARRRNEMTMREAAKYLGLSRERYQHLEQGRRVNISIDELPSLAFLRMPRPELSLREQLVLARRRSGLYIRQIMAELGLSHQTILARESNASRRLIDYWIGKGFCGFNIPSETLPRPVVLVRSRTVPPAELRPRPVLLRRAAS